VIDQGRGFQRAELEQRLATEASNQGAFGLNACRRVAALHHGALELYSRVDSGTEISFETSHFGPREFASNWTAWRLAQRGKEGQRISSTQLAPQDSDQQLRIDAAPARLSLLRAEGSPQYPGCVSIGTVALGATVSLSAANQFDRVLQHQLDVFDFAYRAGPRRWVWGLDADQPAAHYRTDSIDQTVCATLEGIRTTWANLGTVSVQPRQTLKRISDVLIHELLSESTPLGVADKDEVRLGSAPIEFSAETEQRLNQELRRLSAQLNRQTLRLRQQVHRLKEPVSKWS